MVLFLGCQRFIRSFSLPNAYNFLFLLLSADSKLKWCYFYGIRKRGTSWLEVKRLLLGYQILQTCFSLRPKSMHLSEVVP